MKATGPLDVPTGANSGKQRFWLGLKFGVPPRLRYGGIAAGLGQLCSLFGGAASTAGTANNSTAAEQNTILRFRILFSLRHFISNGSSGVRGIREGYSRSRRWSPARIRFRCGGGGRQQPDERQHGAPLAACRRNQIIAMGAHRDFPVVI